MRWPSMNGSSLVGRGICFLGRRRRYLIARPPQERGFQAVKGRRRIKTPVCPARHGHASRGRRVGAGSAPTPIERHRLPFIGESHADLVVSRPARGPGLWEMPDNDTASLSGFFMPPFTIHLRSKQKGRTQRRQAPVQGANPTPRRLPASSTGLLEIRNRQRSVLKSPFATIGVQFSTATKKPLHDFHVGCNGLL